MRAAELRDRSGTPNKLLKEWQRRSVVIPKSAPLGSGHHAEYDDASLVAAGVALTLHSLDVSVRRYVEAFGELHLTLRDLKPADWRGRVVLMRPLSARILLRDIPAIDGAGAVVIDLDMLARKLTPLPSDRQQPLPL